MNKLEAVAGSAARLPVVRDAGILKRFVGRPNVTWLFVLGAGATDTLAWMAWMAGARTQYATVVTALASLFSVVTILLAWAFLHDRLTASQWRGVVVILVGILLVSV